MVQAQRIRENIARGALHHFGRRPTVLGRSLHELFFEFLLEVPVPRAMLGQIPASLHQEFRCPARQIEHLFGRHPEAIALRI